MNMKDAPTAEWPVEIPFYTKDGCALDIVYLADAFPENRGFIIDRLEAYIDTELVGYMNIENVPTASLKQFYPSGAANHACHISGKNIFPWDDCSIDWKTCDVKFLNHFLDYFRRKVPGDIPMTVETHDEFHKVFKTLIKKTREWKEIEKEYNMFIKYHVDKPFVAYSQTENPRHIIWHQKHVSHEGRGIAKSLYMAAAIELEKQGYMLHKSTLIRAKAAGLWEGFMRKGMTVVNDEGDVHLNPEAVRAYLSQEMITTLPMMS